MKSKSKKFQQGTIKRHPDGFGFFVPDNPELPDVYIPRNSMDGIMTNDKVQVEVERERGGDRWRGQIIRVLDRGLKTVVGPFIPYDSGGGIIRDEGKGWGHDLIIKKNDTLNAKKGELVAAEVVKYPDQGEFTGKIVQILGDIMDPLTDIQRVLLTQHIPQKWPDAVLKEAARFTEEVDPRDIKGRKDLRHLNLITIDGATAKDFDDAIYVETNDRGYRLFVAIADVSHYVKLNTAIDQEAYLRGTSVYFPNFVVPMLPEVLSNGLCSLNPHVDRLCLVAEMQFDYNGEMLQSDFYEAVMKSAARVTYGEAQEIMDGGKIEKFKHVAEDIKRARSLAQVLMARRFREGSLDLEIPEVQVVVDGTGNATDILRTERLFAHRLIEEMMLAANVAVAKFLSGREIPAMYRIHEPPNAQAIATLEKFLKSFGGRVKLDAGKLQKRLTKALEEFQGKPEAQILNILTLRSMSQAKYSDNNVGHFGLGFEFYTHFTSPIRRYPDLIVHRLIKSQIMKSRDYRLMSQEDLATAGQMLSACEQRSVRAERQIQSIKKARFMEKFIGQEFDGMISSVTKFGVFVLLRQFEVDGLVSLERLARNSKDTYEFDPEHLRLVAKRSGESFEIGQMLKVRVSDADPELGQIDFELVRPGQEKQQKIETRRTETKSRSATPNRRGRAERLDIPEPDELDLDQVEVVSHDPRGAKSQSPTKRFDPGQKLLEALARRGLKPTEALRNPESVRRLGQKNDDSDSNPRRGSRQLQGLRTLAGQDEERRDGRGGRRKRDRDREETQNRDPREKPREEDKNRYRTGRGSSKKAHDSRASSPQAKGAGASKSSGKSESGRGGGKTTRRGSKRGHR